MAKQADRIGQIIGQRYELLQVIGRGGQGMVYRAQDRWMQRAVAIKVLGSKAAREAHTVERLMREQQALSALKGTSAVELFDVCRGNDGELCLVMELLKGMDLDEYLYATEQRRERVPLQRIADLFEPIVSTLETAHAAGILHRDLKPANIFLLESGDVRLLDFGMARLKKSAPLTAAGTVMGSPSFMAPEAWSGVSDLMDQRADVYSLGVILFRVLAGELPFEGENLTQKFAFATTAARPSLRELRPDLPRAIDGWVEAALAIDRDQRFGNVRALWNALLGVLGVQPRGKRSSFWVAAKGAVQRIAGSNRPAPVPPPVRPLPASSEPSFTREALARSAFRVSSSIDEQPRPPAPVAEATIELRDDELKRIGPPPRKRR
ncbi:MAG TPA: serine/threonine-protein kinase [Polyangiaceae bacterium]|nr:serine/threonine-protein kinase [Polyangiaceae bacterium]